MQSGIKKCTALALASFVAILTPSVSTAVEVRCSRIVVDQPSFNTTPRSDFPESPGIYVVDHADAEATRVPSNPQSSTSRKSLTVNTASIIVSSRGPLLASVDKQVASIGTECTSTGAKIIAKFSRDGLGVRGNIGWRPEIVFKAMLIEPEAEIIVDWIVSAESEIANETCVVTMNRTVRVREAK